MTAVPPTPAPALVLDDDPRRGTLAAYVGYGLLLMGLFTGGLSGFVAMILAYDRKNQAAPVPATHFVFQLRIFWICFALSLAAGALWIGGLFDILLHAPPPRPMMHDQPDAQLVRIAQGWAQPIQAQTWSYSYDMPITGLRWAANWQICLGVALMTGAVLVGVIGPIFGIVRLAAARPIGLARDQNVEPAP